MPTADSKRQFIELSIQFGALKFGEFTLKSGRVSPYFFNAGVFSTGAAMASLGACYAEAAQDVMENVNGLFGPAYKGIPLATATGIALQKTYDQDVPITFDRKEAKAHGEGGILMGAPLQGNILIIDDVITAGTAIRHSVDLITSQGANPYGVVIGLDRCERGVGELSAVEEVSRGLGLTVKSVITMHDIIDWLADQPEAAESLSLMLRYRERYGV
ncbi:MAG TPA: orotate phosphoribosyltransferase [Halieaceae bacterium]|jgi:orotate phosphoribosyltransferase|nr:orotate phosphoribosyltransferase [Pseudomonadales bacterium]MBL6823743.1 orotate phosphoribosyltransferase [Luminiphilus sp.]MDA0893008.1 orotate phosphoribosyltransferase [Pseudomonadota bacterium]RCL48322.1 MAG: orotate phosphoribosyltransferase [Halieaceae bacterium]MBL6901619.1 orotate phosphoribosyltransferase [Luminiphilus sp.]|tara:strand:- start:418 stop:1065 length:648 start_codon:yes stop_codon:yes gene_type:complete